MLNFVYDFMYEKYIWFCVLIYDAILKAKASSTQNMQNKS